MKLFKTYKNGERLPDGCWISLAWRERVYGFRALQFTLTMPWNARIYSIANDCIQQRHPMLALWWERNAQGRWQPRGLRWYCDPLWHRFTRLELARQNAPRIMRRVTAENIQELQSRVAFPLQIGFHVGIPDPVTLPPTWLERLLRRKSHG
jgi:hypothetical protein